MSMCTILPKHNYVLALIWSLLIGHNTQPQWKKIKLQWNSCKMFFDLHKHAMACSHTQK